MKTNIYILLLVVFFITCVKTPAQAQPVAVTDYVGLYANEARLVDVLANDNYDSTNNISFFPIMNSTFDGYITSPATGVMSIRPAFGSAGTDTLYYLLRDMTIGYSDTGMVILSIVPARNAAVLDINGVNALVNANGNLFWDQLDRPYYEIPAGSGMNTIFSTSLMAGGKDSQDSIRLMMDQYHQVESVYEGALDTTDAMNDSLNLYQWNKVWKISRDEIMDFRNHYWEAGYTIPEVILQWPAYGNTMLGQPHYLAPFVDINDDQEYDPLSGDYPFIKGDQAILFICNNPLSGTEADYLTTGFQAIGMVYAYECNSDTLFNNSVFIDYTVINSSVYDFTETYFGMFADFDIGYSHDDFMGSFVDVQTLYGYNADSLDEDGNGTTGYGYYPPAQGITLLKGPLADNNDGIDNDFDNVTDEPGETCGMYSTVVLNNAGMLPGVLQNDRDYYHTFHGYYNDTLPVKWGEPYASDTSSATPCRYMFPGTSDPNWIGTGGVPQTPAVWTEYLMNDTPFDRRGVMSFGPFTFNKNERKSFTVALVYAQQNGLPYYQVPDLLHARIETLLDYYAADSIPCGGSFSGVAQPSLSADFNIFPNPASDLVTVEFAQSGAVDNNAIIRIFNLNGQCVMTLPFTGQKTIFSASGLHEGIYFVQVSNDRFSESKRLVIVR